MPRDTLLILTSVERFKHRIDSHALWALSTYTKAQCLLLRARAQALRPAAPDRTSDAMKQSGPRPFDRVEAMIREQDDAIIVSRLRRRIDVERLPCNGHRRLDVLQAVAGDDGQGVFVSCNDPIRHCLFDARDGSRRGGFREHTGH